MEHYFKEGDVLYKSLRVRLCHIVVVVVVVLADLGDCCENGGGGGGWGTA